MLGADHADALRKVTGPGIVTAEIVCARLRVPVYRYPLRGRLEAIYLAGTIGLRLGLPRERQQHLILHELGHHLMHGEVAEAQFWLRRDPVALSRIESQAEEFAYFFALPPDQLARRLGLGWTVADFAAYYERTPAWVMNRALLADS